MSLTVTVFTKPDCQPCTATKRKLDKRGIGYITRDVTTDPNALARVKELGYSGVPVVECGDIHWGGFSPDRLNRLCDALTITTESVRDLDQAATEYLEA